MIDVLHKLPAEWTENRITSVSVRRLYYVGDGRNAWHGTWVKRYYSSSFHPEWEKARAFAETQRVQGSVFSITEFPVVCYTAESGALLVGELNSDRPLSSFLPPLTKPKANARIQRAWLPWRQDTLKQQLKRAGAMHYPQVGWTIADTRASFGSESIAWSDPFCHRTVVVLAATKEEVNRMTEVRPRAALRRWRSSSIGGAYRLQWSEYAGLNQSAEIRIAKRGALTAETCESSSVSLAA